MLVNSSSYLDSCVAIGTGGQLLALIPGHFVGNCGVRICGVGNCGGENLGHGIEGRMFEGVRDSEDAGDITGGLQNTPDSFISMLWSMSCLSANWSCLL